MSRRHQCGWLTRVVSARNGSRLLLPSSEESAYACMDALRLSHQPYLKTMTWCHSRMGQTGRPMIGAFAMPSRGRGHRPHAAPDPCVLLRVLRLHLLHRLPAPLAVTAAPASELHPATAPVLPPLRLRDRTGFAQGPCLLSARHCHWAFAYQPSAPRRQSRAARLLAGILPHLPRTCGRAHRRVLSGPRPATHDGSQSEAELPAEEVRPLQARALAPSRGATRPDLAVCGHCRGRWLGVR